MKTITRFIHTIRQWEYWNVNIIYFPIYIYWLYLSFKAKSFGFFNASNPKITNGGFALESKMEIYDLIPKQYYPDTLVFDPNIAFDALEKQIDDSNIAYPFIIKPDIGLQGLRVEKINCPKELKAYLKDTSYRFLIQQYINHPIEIGLFYYRIPGSPNGHISGIVLKEFPVVVGDGKTSTEQLIVDNERYRRHIDSLQKKYGSVLQRVLPLGERFVLTPYGNHARGSKFTDVSHKITPELQNAIDAICMQIPEFYYGRLDIMFTSWEDLAQGLNFSIVEVNGAGSEPTHIYDPKHSIFFAWKEIIKHYNILYKISHLNHKKGHSYLTIKQSIKLIIDNKKLTNALKSSS